MEPLSAPFTLANGRLLLVGIGSGALVAGIAARWRGRPVSWSSVVVAVVVAVAAIDRWDDASPLERTDALAALAAAWAAAGAFAVHRAGRYGPNAVPAALLVSLVGVWAAVPENGQVVAVAGVAVGLVLAARVVEVDLGPSGVAALTVAVPWTVAAGATYTELSYVGALLALGLLLWWPVLHLSGRGRLRLRAVAGAGIGHAGVTLAASRWVGSAGDATWTRVALVMTAGGVVALLLRARA